MKDGFARDDLKRYAASKRGEFEKVLGEIVEIPTVSVEPDRKGEVHRGAAGQLRRFNSRSKRTAIWGAARPTTRGPRSRPSSARAMPGSGTCR